MPFVPAATVIGTIKSELEDSVVDILEEAPGVYAYNAESDGFSAAEVRKALKPLGKFEVKVLRKDKYMTECEIKDVTK